VFAENLSSEPPLELAVPSPAAFNASLGFFSHPQSSHPKLMPLIGALVRPFIAPAAGLNDTVLMFPLPRVRNIDGLDAQTRRSSSGAVAAS